VSGVSLLQRRFSVNCNVLSALLSRAEGAGNFRKIQAPTACPPGEWS
jgi:hypothetical protein